MKRLLFLLSILVISSSASAQTGWVRMPDGPFARKHARIHFNNPDTGYVHSVTDWEGVFFALTSNGGETWRENAFRDMRSECPNLAPLGDGEYYEVTRAILTHELLVIIATSITHDCIESSRYSSHIHNIRIGKGNSFSYEFSGRGPSTVYELEDGSLMTSSEDYEFFGDRGTGTVLLSIDSGNSWRELLQDVDPFARTKVAQFANKDTGSISTYSWMGNHPLRVYWTTNSGKSWRIDTTLFGGVGGPEYGHNGLWYSWHKAPLQSTSDLGITWDSATVPPRQQPKQRDSAYYEAASGYRITHSDSLHSSIEFTSDSGKSWTKQIEVDGYLTSISAPSQRVAYAIGPGSLLYKTTDGGGRFASVASIEEQSSKLKAWSSGDEIIVENARDEIRVLDLLGRTLRTSRAEKLDGFAPGMYFVVSGEESVRVLVSP